MRWLSLAIVIALLMPGISGQSNEPTRVIEDNLGDMRMELKEQDLGIDDPTAHWDFQDLEWVDVMEDADGFWFTVKVASIDVELDNTIGFSDGGYIHVFFLHNDWKYRLELERPSGQLEIEYFARLYSKGLGAEDWGHIWTHDDTTWDTNADTITQFVHREDLADSKGAAPFPGRSLTQFHALTSQRSTDFQGEIGNSGQSFEAPWRLGDTAPDTGFSDVSVDIQFGLQQEGNARLVSHEPYRASNGEETTFLYTVNATNIGDKPDLFIIEAENVPGNWDVTVVLPAVELGPGESAAVPVLLATQFAHIHGGTQSFLLTMTGTEDTSSKGRLELGIRFLETPQPAGHHDTVYIHSIATPTTFSFASLFNVLFAPSGTLFFNTDPEFESNEGVDVTGFGFTNPGDQKTYYYWEVPLNPTLRMGLDFDLDNMGEFIGSFQTTLPLNAAVLEGELLLIGENPNGNGGRREGFDREVTTLATFQSEPQDLGPNGALEVTLPIEVTPESDYIPYDPANNVILQLLVSGTGATVPNQNTAMVMQPGASMRLPMFDYEDDVTDVFQALAGPHIAVLSDVVRNANPGDLIKFDMALHDTGAASGDYELTFTGSNSEWATVVEGPMQTLGAGGETLVTVAVQVPEFAADGDKADLFLQAINRADDAKRGIARFVVDVDTDEEWDDDSGELNLEESEESPTVPLALLAFAFVALALRRRVH